MNGFPDSSEALAEAKQTKSCLFSLTFYASHFCRAPGWTCEQWDLPSPPKSCNGAWHIKIPIFVALKSIHVNEVQESDFFT